MNAARLPILGIGCLITHGSMITNSSGCIVMLVDVTSGVFGYREIVDGYVGTVH